MHTLKGKSLFRRVSNRVFHLIARNCPGSTTLRPFLHRLRGVNLAKNVWIGDGVFIDGEYPEAVEIHESAILSIRSMIIAHTRGPGHIIIERDTLIGPAAVIICGGGMTLRIGEGAVISAGSVVTSSVPPQTVIAPPPSVAVARATIPFSLAKSMDEFLGGFRPIRPRKPSVKAVQRETCEPPAT